MKFQSRLYRVNGCQVASSDKTACVIVQNGLKYMKAKKKVFKSFESFSDWIESFKLRISLVYGFEVIPRNR